MAKKHSFTPDPQYFNFTVEVITKREFTRRDLRSTAFVRKLRLTNTNGESSHFVAIHGDDLARADGFRAWCFEQGNFCFSGGYKELKDFHRQLVAASPVTT